MSTLVQTIKNISKTFDRFTSKGGAIKMRPYQLEPAEAIIDSILNHRGLTFVIIISRQAGKDELLANLIAYLMNLYAHREVGIVVANPTYKPQTLNFIVRLENRLKANLLTQSFWKKRSDYMRLIGKATTSLLSGDKDSNVVGATASLLLVINEAQDITPGKFDKDFAPMTASTNATKIIVGTQWTSNTLLAREEDAARAAERADGIRRVFLYTAEAVRKVNKPYGQFVDGEIAKLGRLHPLVKTQYFCERIDAIAGMFNARRLALMQGDQAEQTEPIPGHVYCFLLDVAGQDEAVLELEGMTNPGRDKTTLTIIDVDLSNMAMLQAPTYRAVKRVDWQGTNHVDIFGGICSLVDTWGPLYIVEDATGAGEGLAGMLARRYSTRFIPFKFTAQSKSELGYGYIAIIESGRFHDCARTEEVREQYANCQSEILIGPAKTMRWGVKDGTRGRDGLLIHDDYITADALTAELDKLQWFVPAEAEIIEQADPLEEMDNAY
jgi:hypothetical protein